ncbi:MAG: hypothetical protein Q7S51_11410 [Gallionellaceae bacterium]|nr:hypothetical protein [Gallionellaceae bacterium]
MEEKSKSISGKDAQQNPSTDVLKLISKKYCPRFGQTAVEMGFISEARLKEALWCQIEEELAGHGHRLLGAVLFDKEWMTSDQIEKVMTAMLKKIRAEEGEPEEG